MSLHKLAPLPLVGEDLRKTHDDLLGSKKLKELVVFDLLCSGISLTEFCGCKAVEMSDSYLFVYFKKTNDSHAYPVPVRKLSAEWLSKFKPGDLLFADPNNSSNPLPTFAISRMVREWSLYLDESKVLAMRVFRRLQT